MKTAIGVRQQQVKESQSLPANQESLLEALELIHPPEKEPTHTLALILNF